MLALKSCCDSPITSLKCLHENTEVTPWQKNLGFLEFWSNLTKLIITKLINKISVLKWTRKEYDDANFVHSIKNCLIRSKISILCAKNYTINPYLEIVDKKSTNTLKFVSLFLMSQIGVKCSTESEVTISSYAENKIVLNSWAEYMWRK